MPELNFAVEKAEAAPYAVAPLLNFLLRVSVARPGDSDTAAESGAVGAGGLASENGSASMGVAGAAPVRIHAVALRCQIRIEPARRRYETQEQDRLLDLFGQPSRWGQTLKTMLWTHAAVVVPAFTESTLVELPVPCSFDFNLAVTKYFNALESGEVPLCLLFSGTTFYAADDGALQVEQISWQKEANFRLPIAVWKRMMEMYYPNTAWLCLRKDAFDRLFEYKSRLGIPTWEAAIEKLLAAESEGAPT